MRLFLSQSEHFDVQSIEMCDCACRGFDFVADCRVVRLVRGVFVNGDEC